MYYFIIIFSSVTKCDHLVFGNKKGVSLSEALENRGSPETVLTSVPNYSILFIV